MDKMNEYQNRQLQKWNCFINNCKNSTFKPEYCVPYNYKGACDFEKGENSMTMSLDQKKKLFTNDENIPEIQLLIDKINNSKNGVTLTHNRVLDP